jgi:hypothetical protein
MEELNLNYNSFTTRLFSTPQVQKLQVSTLLFCFASLCHWAFHARYCGILFDFLLLAQYKTIVFFEGQYGTITYLCKFITTAVDIFTTVLPKKMYDHSCVFHVLLFASFCRIRGVAFDCLSD